MKRVSDILLSIPVILVFSTVFIVDRDLFNGIVSGKYFRFYAAMALLSVVAIPAAIIKRGERLSFKLPDLMILLFCTASVLITLNHTGRVTNKCLLLMFAMLFYFYLRIFLADKSQLIYRLCYLAFIVTGLVEAVWGLMQLYGFTSSQHNLFKTTGSFFNPGPYSGWLAMVFPMALGYAIINYFNHKGHEVTQSSSVIRKIASLYATYSRLFMIGLCFLTALSIILVLPAAMSRASWLALLGGSAFIGLMYLIFAQGKSISTFRRYFEKHRKKIVILLMATVILLAVSMAGLFFLKKDSASGRLFTWKIALQTIKEHPLGVGLGNFGGSYGDAQSAYFASGSETEREQYVAEGVEYAFNEYLQICIETGIAPFLVFLAFVVCVLIIGIRNKNYLPAGSLVALLIFASMSYPFNVLPFVIAFVFLSALCLAGEGAKEQKGERAKFAVWAFLVISPVAIALCMYKIYPLYEAYKKWNNTRMLHNMNMHHEAVEEYAGQYPYLQDEIKFLFEYAQSLSKTEQYEKSNSILRRAMQISCDPMLYNIMGKNCQALKQYELAEQNFKKAINLVPNRLYPHYLLAKLYHEMGLKDKAELETNTVLTKPPKVESMAVEEMRRELRKMRRKEE
jgi:tetratricopeptide (TPR) repeat protein